MAEASYERADDTDELLYADVDDDSGEFDVSPLRPDRCDVLLDSIDARLSRLQVGGCGGDEAPLSGVHSMSRDTGLGTQTTSTPISGLDLGPPETKGVAPGRRRPALPREPPPASVTQQEVAGRMRDEEQEGAESRREQCLWRLGRLLGETRGAAGGGAGGGMTPPPPPPDPDPPPHPDSVCTEDFLSRFTEEMVGFPGSRWSEKEGDGGSVEEMVEEEVWWTKCSRSTRVLHPPPLPPPQPPPSPGPSGGTRLEEHDSCDGDEMEVRQRGVDPTGQKPYDHRLTPPHTQASVGPAAQPETRAKRGQKPSSKPRSLAGVPMWSFDTVSIDSDLDSVCTQQITQCIRRRPGWHSFMQSIQNMEGLCTHQRDDDTPTPEPAQEKGRSHGGPAFGDARQTKRDPPRYVQSTGGDGDDAPGECDGGRGRKNGRDEAPEVQLEQMKSDWSKMEALLRTLCRKCEAVEEKLEWRRAALREAESSLSDAQQDRKHALQELAQLRAETAQMEMERLRLEASLRESKASLQLCGLQRKRESCLQPISSMETEPTSQHMTQDGCRAETKQTGVMVSVLERAEMERQLDHAKTELFAEQRRSRDKMDAMQELLDEAGEDLQRTRENEALLRSRCDALEDKQRQKQEVVEALQRESGELRARLEECNVKLGSLKKVVAQKDLQMLGVQEEQGALRAARDALQGALHTLKLQHRTAVSHAQDQVRKMAAEEKDSAVREQAESFTRQLESVQISLQLGEEEARRLREALRKQEEALRKQEEALRKQEEALRKQEEQMSAEATEKVRKAVEVERSTWEKESMAALQQLEERNQETLEGARSDLEEERKNAMTLQKQAAELKTEFARKLWRLEQTGRRAEEEAEGLRQAMGERDQRHRRTTAGLEQRLRRLTQEVAAECRRLCLLVDRRGSRGDHVQLPHSPTEAEATRYLQDLRARLQNLIDHLHQELDAQKQDAQKLRQAKEQELCVQREKMETEKQQALHSLKERLIQEHVEELSSVKRGSGVCRGCGEPGGGVEASLRRQLEAKDQEVRRVQSSMSRWKSQTVARLADKFEEELSAELERCRERLLKARRISKTQEEKPRKLDGAMRLAATESGDSGGRRPVSDPSLCTPGAPPRTPGPSDTASLKLLRHLQTRVRELRAENRSAPPTVTHLRQRQPAGDLSGSYLETVRTLS